MPANSMTPPGRKRTSQVVPLWNTMSEMRLLNQQVPLYTHRLDCTTGMVWLTTDVNNPVPALATTTTSTDGMNTPWLPQNRPGALATPGMMSADGWPVNGATIHPRNRMAIGERQ